jgi:hypothetical protein
MPSIGSAIAQFREDVGALVEVHAGKVGVDLRPYRGRTVAKVTAFAREVLHFEATGQQQQIFGLYCAHRFVAVRSAVGLGKTWAVAVLVLYHLYVERGQVVTLGASDRQVKELMWGAIRQLWTRATLPGELFQQYLRVDESTGQVAVGFVTSDPSKLRGWHHPRLFVALDEAQGAPAWTFDGIMALCTGEANRVVAIGNPGPPMGPWYNLHQNPAWARLVLRALDHVNIREDREVVPGGPSRVWLEHVRAEYGEESAYYRALVLGEFSEEVGEMLLERAWIDAAVERWQSGALEPDALRGEYVASLDVARFGNDSSALILRQGPVVRGIEQWRRCDLVTTVDRTIATMAKWNVRIWPLQRPAVGSIHPEEMRWFQPPDPANAELAQYGPLPPGRCVIDSIGVGSGPHDIMKRRGFMVEEFVASQAPRDPGKCINRRAEATWQLRRLFQEGTLAMPPHAALIEELMAITWFQNPSSGKVQIAEKLEARSLLGRSPDCADALMMVAEDLAAPRGVRFEAVGVRLG